MSSLRELTMPKHKEIENHPYVKYLTSGTITPADYNVYIHVYDEIYRALEFSRFFTELPHTSKLSRLGSLYTDSIELSIDFLKQSMYDGPVTPSYLDNALFDYSSYITDTATFDKYVAHAYVRYFGDLNGGQMIKKLIPSRGSFYDFVDADKIKADFRPLLTPALADEVNLAFDYNIKIMDALEKFRNEPTT
mgnify:FL=1